MQYIFKALTKLCKAFILSGKYFVEKRAVREEIGSMISAAVQHDTEHSIIAQQHSPHGANTPSEACDDQQLIVAIAQGNSNSPEGPYDPYSA
ncbi:MAG TPA: hypothetical protein PKC19_22820, partial [Roseiflexaceae bacterium]|nr:hypothetical protein [Roseiflexaceae bacterium]